MDILCHADIAEVPAETWDRLSAWPGAGVFQSRGWLAAVLRVYGSGEGLWLLEARAEGKTVGLLPLCRERREGVRVVRFAAGERADYNGVVGDPSCAGLSGSFLDWLADHRDEWDIAEWNDMPEGSAFEKACRRWRGAVPVWRRTTACPALGIGPDGAGAARVLAKKSLRRHRAWFQENGGIDVCHHRAPGAIQARLNAFFIQHIHRWNGRADQSLFIQRCHRDFYRELVAGLAPEGKVVLTELRHQGVPVAFHFGFVDRDRLLWYKPSFDPRQAARSPGEVLLGELVAHARDQGLAELDFTRGDEPFKARFSDRLRRNISLVMAATPVRAWPSRLRERVRHTPLLRRLAGQALTVKGALGHMLWAGAIVRGEQQLAAGSQGPAGHYGTAQTVRRYAGDAGLQPAEATVLEQLRPELAGMDMLDVGAGAGRTSVYFGTACRTYQALDIAPAMVDAARTLAGDLLDPAFFRVGDMRTLDGFVDASLDLVLISFNTLDCVDGEGRASVLREVARVLRPGGQFCFSAHNIFSLGMAGVRGPVECLRRLGRLALLRAANPDLARLRRQDAAMVRDASSHYAWAVYYITPPAQVRQLEAAGFRDVRMFPLSGRLAGSGATGAALSDPWIYYCCRKAA